MFSNKTKINIPVGANKMTVAVGFALVNVPDQWQIAVLSDENKLGQYVASGDRK